MKFLRLVRRPQPSQLLIFFQALCVLTLAFALRHAGHNWDEGHLLHPDERFLCMVAERLETPQTLREYFETDRSPLNPHNQPDQLRYVYGTLPLFATHALSQARGDTHLADIARTGRLLSALWSTGTVLLVFLLAFRLGPPGFASWMALLMSTTVLSIQNAHFFTVDSAGVFFATLTLGLGVIAVRENRAWLLAPAGLTTGLAMACRLNLGLLAIWLGFVTLSLFWRRKQIPAPLWLILGGLLALLAFRVAQPYAFDAAGFLPRGLNPVWLEQLRYEHAIVTGEIEAPYTLQWIGRIPWLYTLQQLAAWGMGWPLGLTALIGTAWILWILRRDPGHWAALLALWPVLLIGYHGRIHLHTLRYFLPAYPALILCGGLAIRRIQPRELRHIVAGLITVTTLLYALAFHNIYRQTHPRIQASAWLLQQLPAGGTVTHEHWDDSLPLPLPGASEILAEIRFLDLPVYDPETPEKIEAMLSAIDQSDYLVLSSTRASKTIPRAPLKYPVTAHFYERLLAGRLGLTEVARFRTLPRLGGWGLDSLSAEEAFRVYDHPLVRIFEKNPVWHIDVVREYLLEQADFDEIPRIAYADLGRWNDGRLTPAQWERRSAATPFHERFSPDAIGNRNPVLIWCLALILLGFATFPIAWHLFPASRDRGLYTGRLLGLLLLSFFAWWPAALEWLRFGQGLHLSATLIFLVSALLFAFQHEQMFAWLKRHKRTLIFGELVFWGVFFLFLGLRWLQPDLWHPWAGGEKPMDFAFLNATARTRYFPPHNPWLSGAFIHYYYYGFVLVASLIRMTGISPDIAYNLALPTFAAFTAGGILALTETLFPLLRIRPGQNGRRTAALLSVLLTLFLGNLGQVRWLFTGRGGHMRDGYWNASRVLRVPEGDVQPITEFPFFSHLYGDLHAHLMALPIAILALLAAWQLLRRFHPVRILLCGWLLGTLWVTNTWDLPVQAAIFTAAVFFALAKTPPGQRLVTAWTRFGWWILGLAVARLAYAPYHWQNRGHPLEFEVWSGPRSSLLDLFLAHGLFLVPLLICIPLPWRNGRPRNAPSTHRLFASLIGIGCLLLILGVEWFRFANDIGRMNTVFKFYYQVWWLLAPLTAIALTAAWQHARNPPRKFETALLCVCASLPLLLGALYPITAVPAKLRDRVWDAPRGLDGLEYLKTNVWHTPEGDPVQLSEDLAAIQWLRKHAGPLDILIETVRPQYQWGGRISWHTGQPAVLGWEWHMIQQRPVPNGHAKIHRRVQDVRDFYETHDPEFALRIARRHQIKYVIFGELERLTHGAEAEQKFKRHPQFETVHSGPTAIYRIVE